MEVSSHALSLGRVDDVSFRVALFTNLTRDHLDFHASMDDYRAAKGRLFQRMQDPELQRMVSSVATCMHSTATAKSVRAAMSSVLLCHG